MALASRAMTPVTTWATGYHATKDVLSRAMEFKQKTLANGLVLIGEVNPPAKSAAVGYFVRTGLTG